MSSNNNIYFSIIPIKEIENGKKYRVTIEFPMDIGWIEDVNFVTTTTNETKNYKLKHKKNENNKVYFESEIDLETSANYNYYFNFYVNGNLKKYDPKTINKNEGKLSINFETPDWAKGKIMYHIFVDRYNRGSTEPMPEMKNRTIYKSWNDEMLIGPDKTGIWNAEFYGGDLKGIEHKLDYIKSLGVTILYLSPICYSQSNHRYDTSDYEVVDPYAGRNEDLYQLCQKTHELGMKVVLDGVFNHTGNDSKYFNQYNNFNSLGAYQSKDSPYYDFYRKKEINGKTEFSYWWGMTNLPECDGTSKHWQDYITGENGIIDKWFNLGIDGLRLDVADELTDEFIEKIRIAVKRNKPDGFILGEVWKNPMRMKYKDEWQIRNYLKSGKGMDSVMNYPLVDALIRYFKYSDTNKLNEVINTIITEYPKDTINTLMNFTSTHDISRAINIFATKDFKPDGEWAWDLKNNSLDFCRNFKLTKEQYEQAKEIYKTYVFTLTFLPGILSIFYGDEIGIQGIGNLANRKPYPWGREDNDLLEYFRRIGQIRNKEKFLETANLNIIDINPNYFMFERESNLEKMLITVNRTNEERKILLPNGYNEQEKAYTLKKSPSNHLAPYGAVTYKKN